MLTEKRFVIGIQARTGSQRLPGKILRLLGRKNILAHVVDTCRAASKYLNRTNSKSLNVSEVVVCIPDGDPCGDMLERWGVPFIEGPHQDVLARYEALRLKYHPDYIVRITADCPLIPSFVISKLITIAGMNSYDYVSNVDETCRTSPDGMDCEVFSSALLEYTVANASSAYDLEHVTPFMRRSPPPWARSAMVINFIDQSHVKLSVDTEEDFERVEKEYQKIEEALYKAYSKYGKGNVYRY